MINVTSAQLYIWIASFIWPLTRILGLIAVAPPFGSASVPMLVKVLLGVMISLVIAPGVPIPAALDPMSMTGLMILAQQLVIGAAMGFAVRLVFAAIEMVGELTSNTMGLGFAVFFDPQSQGRSSAISQLFTLLGTLVFFSMGLQLALPMVVALLITNIALGILTRAAPQLNLFGIGFPITMVVGFVLIAICLPYMLTPLQHFLNDTIELVRMLGGMATIPPMPKR